ncbi:hypothetical protein BHE97_05125 [Aeromicrobium sp. PE09-221]|uniref:RNA polymerase sigma factor n=1 Tax=Aeromicrobium sp. PE09-221 TaxID=1898043 RepID=UPI000B3E4D5B|nr:hypothetical protein [Aeromicrobium sp. PE09-221]OUZ11227.1 hypothetical protein BHE97_05125 [Aeromicrobium sp. PE09-221]
MRADDAQRTSQRSDEALVDAARAGDATAYSTLFERHRPAVEHLALCLTHEGPSEMLVGTVFAEGLSRVLTGEAEGAAIRPWLLGLTLEAHGAAAPDSATSRAWRSLAPVHRAVLWHAIVEGAPATETAIVTGVRVKDIPALRTTAETALRTAYLTHQREDAAPLHARTHLDDLTAHADACATCLGLWWAVEDLAHAHELATATLGPAARRYLREPTSRRAAPARPRWVPAVLIATAATLLAATSAGALAVAQWGPSGVPSAWGGLPSVPNASSSPAPDSETAEEPTPETPDATRAEPSPEQKDAPEPSSATPPPSAEEPDTPSPSTPPATMGVGFAFGDPDRLTDGEQRLVRMNLQVVGEPAAPGARQVTVRFDIDTKFRFSGASGLSCAPSSNAVTCTRTLRPGETARASATVVADEVRGRAQVWSSDTSGSPRGHSFSFGPWPGGETPSPEPIPEETTGPSDGDGPTSGDVDGRRPTSE